jgi:neutral ceramidase
MEAGFARRDISAWVPGMTMMGWGDPTQQAQGVAEPLYARASVFRGEDGRHITFVVLELMAVTQGVWQTVLDRLGADHPMLGIGPDNLALVATHTHSGPSGFSHHLWINLSAPGFCASVFEHIVEGTVAAIVEAHQRLEPVRVSLGVGEVSREAGVAFNRSWFAYSRNREVEPVPASRWDEPVDRDLVLLSASAGGQVRGLASWFGLHGTCVHHEQTHLHPDHKGIAAQMLEDEHGVALMAQACCGDVSPNHRFDPARGRVVGTHADDLASAARVAKVQVDVVRDLLAGDGGDIRGPVQAATTFVHFDAAPVAGCYTPDGQPRTTSPARIGLSMAEGTAEGPGPLFPVRRLNRVLTGFKGWLDRRLAALRPPTHDPKISLLELSRGDRTRLAGLWPVKWLPAVDPIIGWLRMHIRQGTAGSDPWIPTRMPLQLLRIGPLVICTVPFETTTQAGRRIRATLAEHLPDDVERIVVSTYANAYCGYLTTFEEYQLQHYEAGYTLFGPFTLGAVRTALAELAGRLGDGDAPRLAGEAPTPVPWDRVVAVPFETAW